MNKQVRQPLLYLSASCFLFIRFLSDGREFLSDFTLFQHSLPLLISQLVQMHLSPLSIFVRSALKRRWVDTDGLCRGKHGKSRWAGIEEYTWGEGTLEQWRCKSTWVYLQTWTVGTNSKIINSQCFDHFFLPFLAHFWP